MRFEILGSMRIVDEHGRHRPIAGNQLRVLLGALLARANQPVAAEHLIDLIWDGAPPPGAAVTVRTHVLRLRRYLGPEAGARIITSDCGYFVQINDGELDALEFEILSQKVDRLIGGRAWRDASETASRALALWRGAPLLDVRCQILHDEWAAHLSQLSIQLRESRIEAELELGGGNHFVIELRKLAEQHPFRENFHAQLMLALYRANRRAEALAAYHQARQILVNQLGIDPGPKLQHLHERILAGNADL
jgi:DNA-binding SARP family transcriptional activator